VKTIRHIALLAISVLLLASCEKMGENDQVSGFWQLVSVQNGSTTTDVTADQIFWGLQNGIISIRSSLITFSTYEDGENCYELIGRYSKSGDNLYIKEFLYHYDSHDESIPNITDVLRKYGIYTSSPHYSIEKNGTTLTLSYDNGILTFRKS